MMKAAIRNFAKLANHPSVHDSLTTDSNLLFSPLSLHAALLLLYAGVGAPTKNLLEQALNVKSTTLKPLEQFSKTYQKCILASQLISVSVVNNVYTDLKFPLMPKYVSKVQKNFNAIAKTLRLKGSEATINADIDKATHHLIPSLLSPGDLRDAVIALVNALYFNATWSTVFSKDNTKPMKFHAGSPKNSKIINTYFLHDTLQGASDMIKAQLVRSWNYRIMTSILLHFFSFRPKLMPIPPSMAKCIKKHS